MARWSIAVMCLALGGIAGSFIGGPALHGQNPPAAATAIPQELTSYRDVVKRVLPAVVSIESRIRPTQKADRSNSPRRRPRSEQNDQIPEEFRRFFDELERRGQLEVPDDTPRGGFGSGFVVDPKGVILTNYHVVGGAQQVEVQLKDGRKFVSRDIHGDPKTDLAIVRIKSASPLSYLELGDSDAMEIGDRVLAVGAPFGLVGSVTSGIVSGKGRNVNVNMYEDFLQTDAAINPGNSGGPLVNLAGQVIGINSVIKSRTGGFQGVGLAIASNLAKNIMQSLLKDGVVHRGYLGIQIGTLTPEVAARLELKNEGGVVVGRVFEDSPASKAGLQAGDVVTALGGKSVKDPRELQTVVTTLPLHKPVDVTVLRDGKAMVVPVTIEEQPEDYGTTAVIPRSGEPSTEKESLSIDKFGIEARDLTPEIAGQLKYKESESGALITKVEPGSVAAEAGLIRGLLVTKVDKKAVNSAAALKDRLEKASLEKGVLLQVESPRGGINYVILKADSSK
jgi:serine protease Do